MIGQELEAVVERFAAHDGEELQAISDNYLQMVFPGGRELMGDVVRLAAVTTDGEVVQGRL